MIKAKRLPGFFYAFCARHISFFLWRRFNKIVTHEVPVKADHSYLLLCNHFSFLDGLIAARLHYKVLKKKMTHSGYYAMSVERQLRMHEWTKYFGLFSVGQGPRKLKESLDYAAGLLDTPGNTLVYFPQGNLESCHIRDIEFQDGLNYLVPQIKGNCQILWCSNIIEYFESFKPSLYMHMLDCGTNKDFDFEKLSALINTHHKEALKKHVRFTNEG